MAQYKIYMRIKYGEKVFDELLIKSKTPIRTYELEGMIQYYKDRLLTFKQ